MVVEDQTENHEARGLAEETERSTQKRKEESNFFVMTLDQRRKLNEWIEFADLGVELHEEAQRIYEKYSFYLQACPTLMLSSVAAILSAGFDANSFEEAIGGTYISHALVLSVLNALNTLLIGCANYWNWQAKAETNKFAAREYDKLREGLRVKRSRMEMGDLSFKSVLDEVEKAIVEVKKQCGPPPTGLLRRHKFRRSIADVSQLQALEHMYNRQDSCFARIAWRCRRIFCPYRMEKRHLPSANNVQRLLDVKIQQARSCDGDDSLGNFWLGMWETYEGAVERSDFDIASKLLKNVAAFHDRTCMAEVIKWQCQERTPLHLAIMYGTADFCNQILDQLSPEVVKFMCVKRDCTDRIPIECITRDDINASIGEKITLLTLQGLCDDAIKLTMKRDEGEGTFDESCGAKALECAHEQSCNAFLKYVRTCAKRQFEVNQIRDKRGYNMAHIAAEANDSTLLEGLLKMESSPFSIVDSIESPHDISFSTKEANSIELTSVLSVALWNGNRDCVQKIMNVHLNCEPHKLRENLSLIDDALSTYAKKMLIALEEETRTIGPRRSSLNTMVESYSKATSKILLQWSPEWHEELWIHPDLRRLRSIKEVHLMVKNADPPKEVRRNAKHVSLLHYAVVRSLPCVVEALVLSGHALLEDSDRLTPYDYLGLRLRWMVTNPGGDASELNGRMSVAKMYPERYRDLRACFEGMFKHAKDNPEFVESISRHVPSVTVSDSWKQCKCDGTALQFACLLQCSDAVESILRSRLRTANPGEKLGLSQQVQESEPKGDEDMQLPRVRKQPSSVHTVSTTLFYKPVELAVNCYMNPIANEGNKEVLRLLLLYAQKVNHFETALSELCSCLEALFKPHRNRSSASGDTDDRLHTLVNMLFHRDELDPAWQRVMVGKTLFSRYESATLVSFPCDQFTFGSLKACHNKGRWYYEVEFAEGLFDGKGDIGVCIGWAAESFSKHSVSQVGGAPFSWSFSPFFRVNGKQPFSQLRLAGSTVIRGEAIKCDGVGVLIDLQTNKISWCTLNKKGEKGAQTEISWVISSGHKTIDFCQSNDAHPLDACFDLGAWRSSEEKLVPCMSCYVEEFVEHAISVRLSGSFLAKLPHGCYPAIVVEDESMESIVPFHNEFGNTPSQEPPAYQYDYMTLLHLATLHGYVDKVEKLYKHGVLYLPMMNLQGESSYDYERLCREKERKCVISDLDSRPHRILEAKGAHRRVRQEDKKELKKRLKMIHDKECANAENKVDALAVPSGAPSETCPSEAQFDTSSAAPSECKHPTYSVLDTRRSTSPSLFHRMKTASSYFQGWRRTASASAVMQMSSSVAPESPARSRTAATEASLAAAPGAAQLAPMSSFASAATSSATRTPTAAPPHVHWLAETALRSESDEDLANVVADSSVPQAAELPVLLHPQKERPRDARNAASKKTMASSPQASEALASAFSLPQSMPGTTRAPEQERERSLAAKAAPSTGITVVSPLASGALAPAFSLPQAVPEVARATEPQPAEAMMMLATPTAAEGSSAFALHIQSPSPSSSPLAPKTRVFPRFEPWSDDAAPAGSADLPMLLE